MDNHEHHNHTGDDKKGGKSEMKMPSLGPKQQFFSNLVSAFLVFLIIITLYSYVSDEQKKKPADISLSELAGLVKEGDVAKIAVRGEKLHVELKSGDKKESKKEANDPEGGGELE